MPLGIDTGTGSRFFSMPTAMTICTGICFSDQGILPVNDSHIITAKLYKSLSVIVYMDTCVYQHATHIHMHSRIHVRDRENPRRHGFSGCVFYCETYSCMSARHEGNGGRGGGDTCCCCVLSSTKLAEKSSGAMYAMVPAFTCFVVKKVCCFARAMPKSATFARPLESNKMFCDFKSLHACDTQEYIKSNISKTVSHFLSLTPYVRSRVRTR